MKIQLALLLVVLFVSLPSVVFSQPPLGAVQSGETSQTAPTAETVEKSWKGSFFGLGLGLGVVRSTVNIAGWSIDTPLGGAILPLRVRLGYGLSDRVVLYYGIGIEPEISPPEGVHDGWRERWMSHSHSGLGIMFRGDRVGRDYYGFASIGVGTMLNEAALTVVGGSGFEVNPGLSLELTGIVKYVPDTSIAGVSVTTTSLDLTFNYHFY